MCGFFLSGFIVTHVLVLANIGVSWLAQGTQWVVDGPVSCIYLETSLRNRS